MDVANNEIPGELGIPGIEGFPVIPETITVHLGAPDQPAENVRVSFADYIKNVASSEIYPTWPDSAIRANILAQISFALNRIYTEHYRSQGYDFDITNNTQYDQKFIKNRDIFDNISKIVDDIFNDYVVRQGNVQPLFTSYCSGTTATCPGLSQWGTVDLAEQGLLPYEILQYYYGDDINIMFNTPVAGIEGSYANVPLRLGSTGEDVRLIQRELNRIGDNYPAIPRLEVDGIFGRETEAAVRKFQEIFNLSIDGIVGKATWYKIKAIYNGVKQLSELESEGLTPEEIREEIPRTLAEGDSGVLVRIVQYLLVIIAQFDDTIPPLQQNGIFDQNMVDTVLAFQREYGLPMTGIVDRNTWNEINKAYRDTLDVIPSTAFPNSSQLYPGRYLSLNMTGDDVSDFQRLLKKASQLHSFISPVEVTGVFDQATEDATRAVQVDAGFVNNGAAGPLTWERVLELSQG